MGIYSAYGPQRWRPGDTPFEVMVIDVLKQNTSWTNVEKAFANFKQERLLTQVQLDSVPVIHGSLLILSRYCLNR